MDFDRVQAEIARRQSLGRSYSGSSIFASKLICGDCGGFYGKKVWHSTDAYRREVWRCNGKFNGEAKCGTPALTTEGIQRMFLQAYNQLMGDREQVIQACEVMRSIIASDYSKLDAEIDALNEEIQVVAGLVNQRIKENTTTQQSQEEYNKKYNRLIKRYEKAVDRLNKATAERESRMQRDRDLWIFISSIIEQPLVLGTWDEGLWLTLLDTATVHADNRITFRFKDGTDIGVGAE
nr:zinc ribbon domain-containing protein [Yeguia hominis]